jgi:integrase
LKPPLAAAGSQFFISLAYQFPSTVLLRQDCAPLRLDKEFHMLQPQVFITPQPSRLDELAKKARAFMQSAKAPATLKAYRSDWRDFDSWCREQQLVAYITDRASTLASETITRRLTAITKAHRAAGYIDSPASTHHFVVGETLQGIRRVIGTAPHGKDPLLAADIRRIVGSGRSDLLGLRDRALTLVGFAGAFRRSELVGIQIADLKSTLQGVVIRIPKSKTDQEGAGRQVGIPFGADPRTCPVEALRRWMEASGIESGPLFRAVDRHGNLSSAGLSKDSVAKVLKRAAARAAPGTGALDRGPQPSCGPHHASG